MIFHATRRLLGLVAFFFGLMSEVPSLSAAQMLTLRGQTMGTTYMVKIFDPPSSERASSGSPSWDEETRAAIDRELRLVNDQMSTYLATSEISRFNTSAVTDWFPVSADTARVVAFAQSLSEITDGAFDVTVGPLVDRWSFGTGQRKHDVPSESEIVVLLKRVGFQKLHVREDPPALRKDIPALHVDLSAIAKGHGVDRVVELLNRRGAENVFVEIGGEVRVHGSKGARAWTVGIQRPDEVTDSVMIAHPMSDSAMATSGDYRNYFEADGERYSHTIDPSSGRPVKNDIASVSIAAKTCMEADAWATALMAVGQTRAEELAKSEDLSVVLITRSNNQFTVSGYGSLASAANAASTSAATPETFANDDRFAARFMPIAVLTVLGLGGVLIAMAVGVLFGRKSISGSCGGLNAKTDPDGTSRCSLCSNPSDACKELREKITTSSHS